MRGDSWSAPNDGCVEGLGAEVCEGEEIQTLSMVGGERLILEPGLQRGLDPSTCVKQMVRTDLPICRYFAATRCRHWGGAHGMKTCRAQGCDGGRDGGVLATCKGVLNSWMRHLSGE